MERLTQEWFLDVVGEIYQAVFDLTQLSRVVERVMHGLASESVILRLQDNQDRSVGFSIYHGYDPSWTKAYQEHFRVLDPYPDTMKKLPTRIFSGDFFMDSNMLKSEYYNDFLRPQKKYYCMGGHILRNKNYYVQLAFQRGPHSVAFGEHEIDGLNILVPHFQKVLQLNQQFSDLNSQKQITEMALGSLPYGVIIFGEQLKPVYMNHAAEELLNEDFGLRMTSGGLATSVAAESRQLGNLLRQGLQLANGVGGIENNGLQITPASMDRRPLNAVVIPLRPESRKLGMLPQSPRVLLFLSTLDQSVGCNRSLLKNLFDLTPAESHLANELAAGRDLEEVADAKGCTRNTVRNQLKAIFAKTGTSRQAELVRLLLTLPKVA
ncbi:MAG: helix-turn-helix transcriptional regulator [Magnetococcales bacterium]|nr:helix-turn-helix transcriptional regulator [Magnetococcales bacterium]